MVGTVVPPDGSVNIWVVRVDDRGGLQADPKPALTMPSDPIAFPNIDRFPNAVFHPSGRRINFPVFTDWAYVNIRKRLSVLKEYL